MPVQSQDVHVVLERVRTGLYAVRRKSPSHDVALLAGRYEEAAETVRPYATSDAGLATITIEDVMRKIEPHLSEIAVHAALGNAAGVLAHSRAVLMALPGDPAFRPDKLPQLDAALVGDITFRPNNLPRSDAESNSAESSGE